LPDQSTQAKEAERIRIWNFANQTAMHVCGSEMQTHTINRVQDFLSHPSGKAGFRPGGPRKHL
jgi:hypothetical protein